MLATRRARVVLRMDFFRVGPPKLAPRRTERADLSTIQPTTAKLAGENSTFCDSWVARKTEDLKLANLD